MRRWRSIVLRAAVASGVLVTGASCARSSGNGSTSTALAATAPTPTALVPADEIPPVVAASKDKVRVMTLPTVETADCFPQMSVWVRRTDGVIRVEDVALYDGRRLDKAFHRVAFTDAGRAGYCTPLGEVVIPPQFDACEVFQEGIAAVRIGKKYGYIDQFGKWLVEPDLEFAYGFWFGLGAVKKQGKYGLVDHAGQWVKEPVFAYMAAVGGGIMARSQDDEEGFLDYRGNYIKQGQLAGFYHPSKAAR